MSLDWFEAANSVVYVMVVYLSIRTAWVYIFMRRALASQGASEAPKLALGILLVAIGAGFEQGYWTTGPLLRLAGFDTGWMVGTKHWLTPAGVLVVVGYVYHLRTYHRHRGDGPRRWLAEALFALSLGAILVAIAMFAGR